MASEIKVIKIIDSGCDRYKIYSDCYCLGRQWDNYAEKIQVIVPEREKENACTMIVSADGEVIDHIQVTSEPKDITNVLSRHQFVEISFFFTNETEYLKNTEIKQFYFAKGRKPEDFVAEQPEQTGKIDFLLNNGFVNAEYDNGYYNFYNSDGEIVASLQTNSDYENLLNKPSINGVTLDGNKTTSELGIVGEETDPTVPQVVKNISEQDVDNWNNKVDTTTDNLVNYYLKQETYTRDEVNGLIATINGLSKSIVDTLPTENIDENTIYLVAKTSGSGNDYYDEYLYINGSFEHIGSTQVNLDGFATTEQFESVNNKIDNIYNEDTNTLTAGNLSDGITTKTMAEVLEGGSGGQAKDINVNEFTKEFTAGFSQSEVSGETEFISQTSPLTQRQRACCYGNGYYVIAGTSGELAYSQDGVNWTKITAFTSDVITGLAYGNGYFVAVDSGGKIFRTDIPANVWNNVSSFGDNVIIESVRYINNQFVACGHYGYILRSIDGENWDTLHEFEDKTTDRYFIDIGYGDGKFIAVGGSGMIYTSINGEIWYDHTSTTVTTDIRAIVYANGQFVIGTSGGIIAYSKDGINWQLANNPSSLTIAWIRNFTYFDNRLYVVMYASNGQGEIWLSKDKGITWEVAQTVAGRLWCVASGNDKFVASGDGGAIYLLDLDLTWSSTQLEAQYIWYRFRVFQNDGSIIYSDVYYNGEVNSSSGIPQEDFDTLSNRVEGIVNNTIVIDSGTNGFKVGNGASIDANSIAIGRDTSSTTYGVSLGWKATNTSGIAIGPECVAMNGVAVGKGVKISIGGGTAVGNNSRIYKMFGTAIGNRAEVNANDSIQLGEGTNTVDKTLQVYNKNIYNYGTDTLTVANISDGTNTISVTELLNKLNSINV